MKLKLTATAVLCAVSVWAIPQQSAKLTKVYNEKFGGFVTQPGSLKGSIGFLNAQEKMPVSEIETVIATWHKLLQHTMAVKPVKAPKGLPSRADVQQAGVSVAIYVVDGGDFPSLLVAPEERWALVNVAKLSEGLKDDAVGKAMLKTRFRAELMRAFAFACGGAGSQYAGNIYGAVDVTQLDSLDADALIMDLVPRITEHLKQLGVTPARTITYIRAYQEGWAPAPTNDFQRAAIEKAKSRKAAK